MTTTPVFLVDDEPEICDYLAHLLQAEGIPSRAYHSAEDFLCQAPLSEGGCLVADVWLGGISGIELQHDLNRRGIHLPVVMISGQATVSCAVAALKAGAVEFFEKPFDGAELVACVRFHVLQQQQRQQECAALETRLASLTEREQEVMWALVEGKKTAAIARELSISASTVEKHRLKLLQKMGVTSPLELVRDVVQHGRPLRRPEIDSRHRSVPPPHLAVRRQSTRS